MQKLCLVQQSHKLTKNQEIQETLVDVFDEINKSLLKDAQIINQLESLIVELKEDDKDKVLQYIFDQYRNYSFAIEWKALEQIFIIQKENEKANYKHIYQELKQKKEGTGQISVTNEEQRILPREQHIIKTPRKLDHQSEAWRQVF